MTCTAFFIAFGPEVRAFLYSGLIDEYAKEGKVLIVTSNPESAAFADCSWPVVAMPVVSEAKKLKRFREMASRVSEVALSKEGQRKWRHSMPTGNHCKVRFRLIKFCLSNEVGARLLDVCEQRLERSLGSIEEWRNLFREHQVTDLCYSAYSSPRTSPAVATARNMGIRTVAIPNSWKDFYIQPRLSPKPNMLWVWDDECQDNYLRHNPGLGSEQVKVKSSLHLEAVRRKTGQISRKDFCSLYELDHDRPIACYTTAAPNALGGEEKIVAEIAKALAVERELGFQLLVRLNPMEVNNRFEEALAGISGVAIQRPNWEWSPENDWCCALQEDIALWAATLEHMSVNISVPSTVTLEALTFDVPVINICFDSEPDMPANKSVKRFCSAPFYRRFFDDDRVLMAQSVDHIQKYLKKLISGFREGSISDERAPLLSLP